MISIGIKSLIHFSTVLQTKHHHHHHTQNVLLQQQLQQQQQQQRFVRTTVTLSLSAGPSAAKSKIPIPIGGYRPSAAIAARNSGRKAPIRRATAPVARVSPPVASSNIPSAGALDGSCNSAPAERTSGYIRRGRIVPLPKADKLRKAPSHGPSCARVVRADPAEVQNLEPASRPVTTHPS
jgi:hypothetical protein